MENKSSDTELNHQNMNEALNSIYDEALRLLGLDKPNAELNHELNMGLELILSLSRYKHDIRMEDEKERSEEKDSD